MRALRSHRYAEGVEYAQYGIGGRAINVIGLTEIGMRC